MKVIILAGGWGTRLGQQTNDIPKPMVKIGSHPIIWHIMKIYSYLALALVIKSFHTKIRSSIFYF